MCWSSGFLCSALVMTKVSSTNLSHREGVGVGTKGFDLKLFHEQVGYEGTDGGIHGSTMDLFISLPWKRKYVFLGQTSRWVTLCWMDMLDLCGKVESCANFCWTIWMDGSTGTEVKRVLTWNDVITSPDSNLLEWICWTKCCVFLR